MLHNFSQFLGRRFTLAFPMTCVRFGETRALFPTVSQTPFNNYDFEAELGFVIRFIKRQERIKYSLANTCVEPCTEMLEAGKQLLAVLR